MPEDPLVMSPLDALEKAFYALGREAINAAPILEPLVYRLLEESRSVFKQIREDLAGWEGLCAEQQTEIEELEQRAFDAECR